MYHGNRMDWNREIRKGASGRVTMDADYYLPRHEDMRRGCLLRSVLTC